MFHITSFYVAVTYRTHNLLYTAISLIVKSFIDLLLTLYTSDKCKYKKENYIFIIN